MKPGVENSLIGLVRSCGYSTAMELASCTAPAGGGLGGVRRRENVEWCVAIGRAFSRALMVAVSSTLARDLTTPVCINYDASNKSSASSLDMPGPWSGR